MFVNFKKKKCVQVCEDCCNKCHGLGDSKNKKLVSQHSGTCNFMIKMWEPLFHGGRCLPVSRHSLPAACVCPILLFRQTDAHQRGHTASQ